MRCFFALLAGFCCLGLCTWMAFAETRTWPGVVIPQTAVANVEGREMLPQISGDLEFQGSLSCMNSACHGNEQPDTRPGFIRRDEFYVWSERDPHAKAYKTLVDDWSKDASNSIAKKLGIKSMSDPQFKNCLACHSPNRSLSVQADHSQPSSSPFLSSREGVGCEACHGPAERWRTTHYRSDWNPATTAAHGMLSTKGDLVARARLCAECHVGSENREVNHDMIAAGHPMLRFEMTAYMDMMPKHWKAAGESSSDLWAAGQIAAADAALGLLEARAAKASPQPLWPEFSEYACFQCHHDLNPGNWRPERKYGMQLAAPKWGDWYFTMLDAAAEADESAKPLADALAAVKASMDTYSPDPATVQKNAETARQELYKWAHGNGKLHPATLVAAIAKDNEEEAVASWDTATQVYLALVAVDFARPGLDIRSNVRTLLNQVKFPTNYGSPKGFTGSADDSQTARGQFLLELTEIINKLPQQQDN